MADKIKDFIKQQVTPINIGVPKNRNTAEPVPVPQEIRQPEPSPVQGREAAGVPVARPGRPRSEIQKVKLSMYVPEEVKERLVRIQHETYKTSLNDTLVEAVMQYLERH